MVYISSAKKLFLTPLHNKRNPLRDLTNSQVSKAMKQKTTDKEIVHEVISAQIVDISTDNLPKQSIEERGDEIKKPDLREQKSSIPLLKMSLVILCYLAILYIFRLISVRVYSIVINIMQNTRAGQGIPI